MARERERERGKRMSPGSKNLASIRRQLETMVTRRRKLQQDIDAKQYEVSKLEEVMIPLKQAHDAMAKMEGEKVFDTPTVTARPEAMAERQAEQHTLEDTAKYGFTPEIDIQITRKPPRDFDTEIPQGEPQITLRKNWVNTGKTWPQTCWKCEKEFVKTKPGTRYCNLCKGESVEN